MQPQPQSTPNMTIVPESTVSRIELNLCKGGLKHQLPALQLANQAIRAYGGICARPALSGGHHQTPQHTYYYYRSQTRHQHHQTSHGLSPPF